MNLQSTIDCLMANPDGKIVLHAESHNSTSESAGAMYELSSGTFRKLFLSAWGIFSDREIHETVITELTHLARSVIDSRNVNTIVTCTSTAKYLMEELHSRLEKNGREIDVQYFGPYPYHVSSGRGLNSLKGKRVIIITDFIASGRLISNLRDVVEELGGQLVATLALGVTNAEHIKINKEASRAAPHRRIPVGPMKRMMDVYSLFDAEVKNGIQPDSSTKCIKIHPTEIRPVFDDDANLVPLRPIFDTQQLISDFEASNALDFRFFKSQSRFFTIGVRIENVLNYPEHRTKYRRFLDRKLPSQPIFLSTHNKENLLLLDLLKEARPSALKPILIPRADQNIGSYYYFFTDPIEARSKIENSDVVIPLATINTSERLRNIVSLISSFSPNSITIVSLIDRMDQSALGFVPRVESLHRLSSDSPRQEHASFEIVSFYRLVDFSTNQIIRMNQSTDNVLRSFGDWTRVSSFREQADLHQRYFMPALMTSLAFKEGKQKPLLSDEEYDIIGYNENPVRFRFSESKMLVAILEAIENRDYSLIFKILLAERRRPRLFRLYGILSSDISYLRASRALFKLLDDLLNHLTAIRKEAAAAQFFTLIERYDGDVRKTLISEAETESREEAEESVRQFSYHIFGLGLLVFLQPDERVLSSVLKLCPFLEEKTVNDVDLRIEANAFFREPRSVFSLAFFLYLSSKQFRDRAQSSNIISEVVRLIDSTIIGLHGLRDQCETGPLEFFHDHVKLRLLADVARSISHLEDLKNDLGAFPANRLESSVRYLHKVMFVDGINHSPLATSLNRVFREHFELEFDGRHEQVADSPQSLQFHVPRSRHETFKRHVDEALAQCGVLSRISDCAEDLFLASRSIARRGHSFESTGGSSTTFESDVNEMVRILKSMRDKYFSTRADLELFIAINERIDSEIFFYDADLPRILNRYISDARVCCLDALGEAEVYFRGNGLSHHESAVSTSISVLSSLTGEYFVLFDESSLAEIFKNIFTNLRHSSRRELGSELSLNVKFEVKRFTELLEDQKPTFLRGAEPRDFVVVSVRWPGDSLEKAELSADSTILQHMANVEDLGGQMRILPSEAGCEGVELVLISRALQKKRYEKLKTT